MGDPQRDGISFSYFVKTEYIVHMTAKYGKGNAALGQTKPSKMTSRISASLC